MNIPLCGGRPGNPWPRGRQCCTSDNGSDPILGPPFPPTNYQLFINLHPTIQPRLTWTVPDVIIEASLLVRYDPLIMFEITIENYEWPAWGIGIEYEINQRVTFSGVRYFSLQSNNIGNTPASFPSHWALDPTEFELYQFNGNNYNKVGDSTGVGSPYVTWNWTTLAFIAQVSEPWDFYVVANAGISVVAESNTFGFVDTCTAPAPTNLAFTPTGPQGGDFTWLEGGTGALLDYVLVIGDSNGGPYNVVQAVVAPDAAFYHVDGLSAGTYFAIMCRRDSLTCVSPASNEVTFSLP